MCIVDLFSKSEFIVLNYENDIKKVTQFKGLTEELAQVKKDKNRKALEAREAEQVHWFT